MRTLFILTLFAAMSASVTRAFATVSTASTASEFVTLWNTGVSTITLSNNINLGGTELPEPGGPLTITSGTAGDAYMLIASSPLVNVNLENVKLENSQAGQGALVQLTEGYQGQVSDTIINSAYSTGDGGAVHVEDGAELTVNGGSSFTNNKAEKMGGAIAVADQTDDSTPHLVLLAQNGKNITFSSNESEVKDSTVGSIGNPNDIYLGKNGCMQLTADSESKIQILSGVASADSSAAIVKTGKGTATLGNGSDYHGSLAVDEGTVVMAQDAVWGDGSESLTLGIKEGATLELQRGAYVNGSLTSAGTLAVTGNTTIAGGLETTGAAAVLKFSAGATLTMNGTLTLGDGVTFLFDGFEQGRYQLVYTNQSYTYNSVQLGTSELYTYSIDYQQHAIFLTVEKAVNDYLVTGKTLSAGEVDRRSNVVIKNLSGSLALDGEISPRSIEVSIAKNLAFKSDKKKPGCLKGDADLSKWGAGALTLNTGNSAWSGDIYLYEGTIKVAGNDSLGSGKVYVEGGILDLASKLVANDIKLNGAAVIKGGAKYTGEFTMTGGVLQKGSVINVADTATLEAGTMDGTLSGTGMVQVTGAVTLGDSAKVTTTQGLTVAESGALTIGAKGLAMDAKTSTLTIDGGSLASAGKLSGYALFMSDGATLTASNAKPMAVNFKGGVSASGIIDKSGMVTKFAEIGIYGAFTATELDLTGSKFTLEMNPNLVDAKNQPKAQSITINGKGTDSCLDSSEMIVAGKMSVTGDLTLQNSSSLTLYDPSGKNAAMPLAVKGALTMSTDSELSLNGKLSVASLSMTDSNITLSNATVQSIALTMARDSQKLAVNNTLTNSQITANASMSVAGNLELSGASSIHLWDANTAKPKALNLAVKGNLTLGSGSSLTLSGALSAANLTLDGGTINLTGTKPQTIKVSNQLVINSGTDINFNFTVTAKDVNKKAFKILTFMTIGGYDNGDFVAWTDEDKPTSQSLLELLGLKDAGCTLTLDVKKKNISLTVNDLVAWEAAMEDGEDDAASEETPAPMALAALPVVPDFSPVADALVQANWGQVEASRAFVNAIGSRSMAVQLGSGERAVWAGAIGASSCHSTAGGHNGADTNVTGGALGVETQLGESSLLGVALGSSRTRVSAHNYGTIKQDTTHIGLYGQTNWNKLSADWSAAYGRSDSEIHGSSWKQNHLQLDGRVSYNHALSSSTVLRGFGGMQYYASDSATVDGIKTGSIQNLRAEIGVGASHAIGKLGVYGEVAVHQDLVRHNPGVTTPDARYRGMNPGRTGLNFTVGASYGLTEQWSVNASYTGEVVENANAHSASVGATYKF